MKFSIRAILALTFLAALTMLAWQSRMQERRNEARVKSLQAELAKQEALLQRDNAAIFQAKMHELDRLQALRELRENAMEQFGRLLEKYGKIEQRADDTLSLRSLPTLPDELGSTPTTYRLIVPEQRQVWLKAGVHSEKASTHSSAAVDALDFLRNSPYQPSGPFEMRLPPGDHTLSFVRDRAEDDGQQLRLTLNGEVLLRTRFVAKGIEGGSGSNISFPEQKDVPPDQPLPWLASLKTRLDSSKANVQEPLEFSIWLSNQPSGFEEFPDK